MFPYSYICIIETAADTKQHGFETLDETPLKACIQSQGQASDIDIDVEDDEDLIRSDED